MRWLFGRKKETSAQSGKGKGNAFRRLRQKLDLSQDQMAELMGVSKYTIRAWERGVNKPAGSAVRLLQLMETNKGLALIKTLVTSKTRGLVGPEPG